MHLLNVTTATLDDLIEPVDLGQRAGGDGGGVLLGQRPRGAGGGLARTGLPELRLARAARTCGIRCRSTSGSSGWRRGRGWSWCGCSAATTGGPTAATGWRRWRGSGGSRWRCCRGSAGRTTRGWRRCRRSAEERAGAARPTSARAGRRTWRRCWRGWRGSPGGRGAGARRCRGPGCGPAGGCVALADARPAGGRWCRSSSIARCCSPGDHAPVEALVGGAGRRRGSRGCRSSCRACATRRSLAVVEAALRRLRPAALVTATAFAAARTAALFDRLGVPVFQVVPATTRREAWAGGQRGLAPADLAMHVVLPELDGRILAGAVSFKEAGGAGRAARAGAAGEPAGAGPGRAGGAADRGVAAAGGDAGGRSGGWRC